MSEQANRITTSTIRNMKGRSQVVALTAYTHSIACQIDPYADLVLVGDSLGMVLYGMPSTVPVTLDMMIMHGRAVSAACQRALVVVDMPFGSYQSAPQDAFKNASRILKETGCSAVKLEGGTEMEDTVRFLTARGIAVCGHVGLQPQSVLQLGGFKKQGKSEKERNRIVADAIAISNAGAFGIVLECVDPLTAQAVTRSVDVPVIGIGAGHACDGQILVTEDMTGMNRVSPSFVKRYDNLHDNVTRAVKRYASDVKTKKFPELHPEVENIESLKRKRVK